MTRAFRFVVAVVALWLSSCTPGTKYFLFNNAGEEIEIITVDRPLRLGQNQLTELDWLRNPLLLFRVGSRTFGYAVALSWNGKVSVAGVELQLSNPSSGAFTLNYCFQLEKNGDLYYVSCNESLPVSAPRSQPQGFPLHPSDG